jgi:hypothetical protein
VRSKKDRNLRTEVGYSYRSIVPKIRPIIIFKFLAPVIYGAVLALQEVLPLRARRWCFLGPLRARAGSIVHITMRELP